MGENIISINGKRYDAKTGRLLGTTSKKHNGASIDGFSKRPSTVAPKPVVAAHDIHSKTEKSKTLMRGVVNKPNHPKVHSTTTSHTAHHKTQSTPLAIAIENRERAARAAAIAKNKLISRFGHQSIAHTPTNHTKIAHLPVTPAPAITNHHSAPIITREGATNPFHSAVEHAVSHEQTAPHKTSKRHKVAKALRITPRAVSFGSFVIAGLLLGGFFVYQNIPNLAMRVAAARSGVQASLPGYKPAGFAMNGRIKYGDGKISIGYRSVSDDRAYQITQSNSQWNSETLLDNYVAVNRRAYQTYQDKGKTIYIYNDNDATWIDGGVWYQVEGKSSLNSDQLIRIANSL